MLEGKKEGQINLDFLVSIFVKNFRIGRLGPSLAFKNLRIDRKTDEQLRKNKKKVSEELITKKTIRNE